MASAKGSSRAVLLPTQSASVERSRSSPSRSKIWLWRYSHTQGTEFTDDVKSAIGHQARRLVEIAAKLN